MTTANNSDTTLATDERAALRYGKRMMSLYSGLLTWVILALIFFPLFGFNEPALYWAFGGSALGLLVQGLYAAELIRLPTVNIERRLVEKRLGRKL